MVEEMAVEAFRNNVTDLFRKMMDSSIVSVRNGPRHVGQTSDTPCDLNF
jgi:hypothetical protein